MRLDRKMVNIMDHENKEVVERFPIHLVREPTAFTSSDPKVRIPVKRTDGALIIIGVVSKFSLGIF